MRLLNIHPRIAGTARVDRFPLSARDGTRQWL